MKTNEQQIQNISSERAIENLMVSYAYINDDGNIKGLGDLFSDATFRLDNHSATGRQELEAIAGSMITLRDDSRSATTHEITNIMIEIDADGKTATGKAYWTLYKTISGSAREAVLSGRYLDKLVYRENHWSFLERNATTLWKLIQD